MRNNVKIFLLEQALDSLCKAISRDIFVIMPEKEDEKIPYLVKEIKETLDWFKSDSKDFLK